MLYDTRYMFNISHPFIIRSIFIQIIEDYRSQLPLLQKTPHGLLHAVQIKYPYSKSHIPFAPLFPTFYYFIVAYVDVFRNTLTILSPHNLFSVAYVSIPHDHPIPRVSGSKNLSLLFSCYISINLGSRNGRMSKHLLNISDVHILLH